MAQSPPPAHSLDHWVFSQGWGWAGHSDSTSPASSSDSSGSCPCDSVRGASQPQAPARSTRAAEAAPTAPRRARAAPGGGQRQSASEREKLRMRTLARALHELRRFLPPSVAPAGQSLTKIETLRLAIRYIGHLSAVLGLSEDSLQRRRRRRVDTVSARGCPLCPDGGPTQAQAQTLSPGLGPAAYYGASWESPPACTRSQCPPENLQSRVSDVDPWATPPYCSQIQSPLPHSLGRALNLSLWTPSQTCPGTQTSPVTGNKAGGWTPPPVSAELAEMYQVPGCQMQRMEGALVSAGEEVTPWEVKSTSTIAVSAAQQSPQLGEERIALGLVQRPGWKSLPMSPESCLSLESPGLLPHPSCQRLQPQPQWGCWDHDAEVLPSSENQDPCPTFPADSPTPSLSLRLSGCPELWQEGLEGSPLNIY